MTVMSCINFETIGCTSQMESEMDLSLYQRPNHTMQPALAGCHNDLYIRKKDSECAIIHSDHRKDWSLRMTAEWITL